MIRNNYRNSFQEEAGRTLVEMLGVLVVMGVLAVGAVMTYRSFVNKTKVQNTAKMIRTMALERQNSAIDSETGGRDLRRGPHCDFYLENKTEGKFENYFSIETTLSDVSFCEELKKSDAIGAELVEGNCPGKITFYFEKNPYYSGDAGTWTDESGNKHFCPEHVAACEDESTPTSCENGYYLSEGGSCVVCPENSNCTSEGYTCLEGYYNQEKSCHQCPEHVLTCEDENTPTACEEGYYVDGENCSVCPENSNCTSEGYTCLDGYYNQEKSCHQCPERVATCEDENTPTSCEEGYELYAGKCVCSDLRNLCGSQCCASDEVCDVLSDGSKACRQTSFCTSNSWCISRGLDPFCEQKGGWSNGANSCFIATQGSCKAIPEHEDVWAWVDKANGIKKHFVRSTAGMQSFSAKAFCQSIQVDGHKGKLVTLETLQSLEGGSIVELGYVAYGSVGCPLWHAFNDNPETLGSSLITIFHIDMEGPDCQKVYVEDIETNCYERIQTYHRNLAYSTMPIALCE